jgi:hypothetical protein
LFALVSFYLYFNCFYLFINFIYFFRFYPKMMIFGEEMKFGIYRDRAGSSRVLVWFLKKRIKEAKGFLMAQIAFIRKPRKFKPIRGVPAQILCSLLLFRGLTAIAPRVNLNPSPTRAA